MNRAGLIDRAIREAKNAGQYQMPRGQYGNTQQNYLPNDPRTGPNVLSKLKETPYESKSGIPMTGPAIGGGGRAAPGPPPFPPGLAPGVAAEGRSGGPPGSASDGWWKETAHNVARMELARSKAIDELRKDVRFRQPSFKDSAETRLLMPDRSLFALELSGWFARPNAKWARKTVDEATKKLAEDEIVLDKLSASKDAAPNPPAGSIPPALPIAPALPPAAQNPLPFPLQLPRRSTWARCARNG